VKENFDAPLKAGLKHEGGYVNNKLDQGGMNKLGVTKPVWEAWVKKAVGELCVEKGFKLDLGENFTWFVKNEVLCNTSEKQLISNITENCKRDLGWLIPVPAHNRTLCIVGGSPSLKKNMGNLKDRIRLGADVMSTNGSLKFLATKGVTPDFHAQFDGRVESAEFVASAPSGVVYLIGSMSDPSVLDNLKDKDVTLWHGGIDIDEQLKILEPYQHRPIVIVGGGQTIGLRAMMLAYHLGYRKIIMYGIDSSFSGGEHHAYEQVINNTDRAVASIYNGKTYECAPWMYRQAKQFEDLHAELTKQGVKITVIGDGLIPDISRSMEKE